MNASWGTPLYTSVLRNKIHPIIVPFPARSRGSKEMCKVYSDCSHISHNGCHNSRIEPPEMKIVEPAGWLEKPVRLSELASSSYAAHNLNALKSRKSARRQSRIDMLKLRRWTSVSRWTQSWMNGGWCDWRRVSYSHVSLTAC